MRKNLSTIWNALWQYRVDCIPVEAEMETYNEEWDEICRAMAHLHEALGIEQKDHVMTEDIHLKDFYKWLDTYPDYVTQWEVTGAFEGVRYVRFLVREDEDE